MSVHRAPGGVVTGVGTTATLGTGSPGPDPFAAVDPHVPLALLPVRLETRFGDPGADVLHVRVFPDEIHVDGHDPALTQRELALGAAMWSAPNDLPAADEAPPPSPPPQDAANGRRARWASMVGLLGGPRAAWVARSTRPGAPAPATKTQSYERVPVARALPDRWPVRAYAGETVVGEAWSAPVTADPALGPDPAGTAAAEGDSGLPPVDAGMKWLLDYSAALSAGMAVDVPLAAGTNSLDRVVAVGVRTSTAPADAATELADLLTAHRYTDGLGFLSPGSPTANAPDARAAADRHADPGGLWQQEFGPPSGAGTAAGSLAAALGIPLAVLDGTGGAGDPADAHARAMQTALWAATWGYYLGQLMDASGPSAATIDAVRSHYLSFVRGRGTLPTLRVGRQPYGVMPSLPLASWSADGESATVDGLARVLRSVRPLWEYGAGQPLTTSPGSSFDQAFAAAMSTDAVARSYSVRSVIADRTLDPLIFTGVDTAPSHAVLDALLGALLPGGHNPLILDVLSPTAQPVRAPLVVDPRDPSPDATVHAAIGALAAANPAAMLTGGTLLTPSPGGPATLLHTLLRRSLLLEYAAAGLNLKTPVRALAGMLAGLTPEPAGGFTPATSLSSVISEPVPWVTGGLSAGEWLWQNPGRPPGSRQDLDQTLSALGVLGQLSASELELLLPETLDLATHRFTAWAESIAAEKLSRLRQATPAGATLGGWGIVERLERQPRTSVDPSVAHGAASAPLWAAPGAGGFVHAPSTAQAATAAILRAGHLAHGGDGDPAFAVDLSSARGRAAIALADGIRAGQELGALLGYELERFLHERAADQLIAPLREYAPRWKASGTFVEGDPTEGTAPSAVLDGLALATQDPAAVAQAVLPGGPAASPALSAALADGLASLQDHERALADLLLAEAVHHALQGNAARASGALDAAHRGGVPPDSFEVLRTPRRGAALTGRVGVLMAPATGPLAGGWPASPRGAADPDCSAWAAAILPPLASVRVRISDAAGTVSDAGLPAAAPLGPLDLALDLPAVVRTRIELSLATGSTLVPGRDPSWTPDVVSLDELLTVSGPLREVLASRQLAASDLPPATGTPTGADARDAVDLGTRVAATRTGLQQAAAALASASSPLQAALAAGTGIDAAMGDARAALATALGYGLTIQLAPEGAPDDVLAALGSAASEFSRRLAAPAPPSGASADDLIAALKGLLGSAQPALARLALDAANAAAVTSALAAGDSFLAAEPELAGDWVADVAAVRAGAGHLASAVNGCEALSAGRGLSGRWRILDRPGPQWSATLSAGEVAAVGPVATSVMWSDGAHPTAGQTLSGLIADEWVEVVPEPTAATSIAYEAEAPAARAPQAILLGLAPAIATGWTVDAVAAIATDAIDLAAIRLVDGERAAWTGRMLPAVLLPDGDASDVIAAPATGLLEVDTAVLAAARASLKALG